MALRSFSTDHINYLQRSFLGSRVQGSPEVLFRGVRNYGDLRLLHITDLSRFWQSSEEKALSLRQLMLDVMAGLHAEQIPMVFIVLGTLNRVSVLMGTFHDNEQWPGVLSSLGVSGDVQTIAGSLESAFPGVFLRECSTADWTNIYDVLRHMSGAGLITGIPTAKIGSEKLGVEQTERLIRGMYGHHWAFMVVAKPFQPHKAVALYNQGMTELREVVNAQASSGANPIADAYSDLIKHYMDRYSLGKAIGLWRVSAYCLGRDLVSSHRIRAVACAVFSGEESLPDSVRVLDCSPFVHQIAHLGQLVAPCLQAPPGNIRYDYEYASILNSSELATLAHLPQEEMPGYAVKDYARFDVSPPDLVRSATPSALVLGEIIDRGKGTGNEYTLSLARLAEHGLIVGVTGSGKTNTAMHLLHEVWRRGTPFLVIEPAKTEYRRLLRDSDNESLRKVLRVFTLGDERVSPFRVNPFQVLPGFPVQTHIDHLKAIFNASFTMYGPMPHVLEQCLYGIYEDRGWDLASGKNLRGRHPLSFPTLTDLFQKVDQIVDALGYGPRITPELKAALKVRINSLRAGGKGLMLDTSVGIPISTLLEQPTVLELQAMADNEEKSFIMGLIWTLIYEYYQTHPPSRSDSPVLRHLTLVEEAHRLLANVPLAANLEIANTRGKAVETFCQMLAEIRAYGEGMLIAEQIPGKLAPDAIKNTNLKLMHRTISEEDRLIMSGSMNMDEYQMRATATFEKGWAAVYAEGDDRPCLIRVPLTSDRRRAASAGVIKRAERDVLFPEKDVIDAIRIVNPSEDLGNRIGPASDIMSPAELNGGRRPE